VKKEQYIETQYCITKASTKDRKQGIFVHTKREEVIQLPTDYNGVSIIDECMSHQTWCGVTKWGWRNRGLNRGSQLVVHEGLAGGIW